MLLLGVTLQSYAEETTFKIDMIYFEIFFPFWKLWKEKCEGFFWEQWQTFIIVTKKKTGTIFVG